MKACYLIPALWILSCATLRHTGGDNVPAIKERHKRMVFDIIPQTTTKVDEKENNKETGSSLKASKLFGTHKMFKKSVTQIMRTKIKKWFRRERRILSTTQFLKDMKVLSDKLEAISKHS